MDADLDALATRLYVTIDDLLADHPEWQPEGPAVGITPRLCDAICTRSPSSKRCLATAPSGASFVTPLPTCVLGSLIWRNEPRTTNASARPQPQCNTSLPTLPGTVRATATTSGSWTPHPWNAAGPAKPSNAPRNMAGYASYGYCASHSRWFWGRRLHLITTPSGLPVAYALTSAKTDERDTALAMLELDPNLTDRSGQILMADKGYRSASFETELNTAEITLIRPTRKSEKPRPGQRFLRPFRQIIESVNQTFKAQLDLERHGGRKPQGVCARILQRILALTTTIWHNETTNQPGPARSLIAYDH